MICVSSIRDASAPRAMRLFLALAAVAAACSLFPSPARALTPDSPQVKRLVANALGFLENAPGDRHDDDIGRSSEKRDFVGIQALIGMVYVKTAPKGDEANTLKNPKVQAALNAIKADVASNFQANPRPDTVYTIGLSILFLCELDSVRFRPEIEALVKYLLSIQKQQGGWGYLSSMKCDNSMTQFAAVSLWVCEAEGIPVDIAVWERMCNYAIRTQDPSGAWGYQAIDPGNFTKVAQDKADLRHSMVAAGLGILTLSAERCGILEFKIEEPKKEVYTRTKRAAAKKARPVSPNVDASKVKATLSLGDAWLKNNYTVSPNYYPMYFLYAFERYQTIREHTIGTIESDPKWYNDGVAFLESVQGEDGAWVSTAPTSRHPTADTCFAVLFLIRSFRKIIEKKALGAGNLIAGRGAPEERDPAAAAAAKPLPSAISELLVELEANAEKLDANIERLKTIQLSDEVPKEKLNEIKGKLAELMVTANSPALRQEAVRTLASDDNLENAPLLIQAMHDDDSGVIREADNGLRRLARKVLGVAELGKASDAEVEAAIVGWKLWYRSLKPDARFGDEEEQE